MSKLIYCVLFFGLFVGFRVEASTNSDNYVASLANQFELPPPPACTPTYGGNPTGTGCASGFGTCEEVVACPGKDPVFTTICIKCPKGCDSARTTQTNDDGCEETSCTCAPNTPD
jgi:hypothetical protein